MEPQSSLIIYKSPPPVPILSQRISPAPRLRFYGEQSSAPPPPPNWRTTPCRLSATVYSIYSQLPSILEAFPPSATRRPTMPWWEGPTYHGSLQLIPCIPTQSLNYCFQECWYSLLVTSVWVCMSQTTYRTLMEYISWQTWTSLTQLHPYEPWRLHSVPSA